MPPKLCSFGTSPFEHPFETFLRGIYWIVITFDIIQLSIYTLGDLGVLSNLIGSLSLANEHYSPPTE